MYRHNAQFTDRKGTFDPHDADRVKHVRMGVWDLYEEHEPKLANIPGSSRLEKYMDIMECLPYVGRMIRDVLSIPSCAFFLGLYVLCNLGQAFLPALGLWYVFCQMPTYLSSMQTFYTGTKDSSYKL